VDEVGWHRQEFRDPPADVLAVRVEPLGLADRVEDPEVRRRVRSGPGHPLPVADVLADVGVEELMTEPPSAPAPVDEQILDEKRSRDHAHTVVHPALCEELTHAGVDEGKAGHPLLPGVESGLVVTPRDFVVGRLHRPIDEVRFSSWRWA
jgi:hypothetical protein